MCRGLSGGFTPCRHLRPSSGREHTMPSPWGLHVSISCILAWESSCRKFLILKEVDTLKHALVIWFKLAWPINCFGYSPTVYRQLFTRGNIILCKFHVYFIVLYMQILAYTVQPWWKFNHRSINNLYVTSTTSKNLFWVLQMRALCVYGG